MAARPRELTALLAGLVLTGALAGCATSAGAPQPSRLAPPDSTLTASPSSLGATPTTTTSTPTSMPTSMAGPSDPTPPSTTARVATPFDGEAALERIRRLASIGPRDAASRAYARAAAYVTGELEVLGYRVRRQEFPVPAGTSWGVRVPAGTSANVIAEVPGFDVTRPHVVIGAHLDTVPQAPGAEDNASGIAVMVELARMLREQPSDVPVRLVAFGAEESRGSGPSMYAFGSRHYVARMAARERSALRGMVSLDRVGVRSARVPVCFGGQGTRALADALRKTAGGVPTSSCRNRASDHVSFERVGIPAVRLGSVPYDAYHSSDDVPRVVDTGQLQRTGAVMWSWLRSLDG